MTETGATVEVRRRIAAPAATIYAYLTDSNLWARWQGAAAVIDARAGGEFRMTLSDGTSAEGRFVLAEPSHRIVFTWGWRDNPTVPPGSSTVEIVLLPDGDGTIVSITHRGLPPGALDLHAAGWNHYLPRLVTVAEGGDPGPDAPPAGR